MSSHPPNRLGKRRHSKACARCRGRKIRCDFQYPICGACSKAGATCLGFDPIHGVDKPRSAVSHLEQEVARLEIELGRVNDQPRNVSDIAREKVETLTSSLAMAILEPSFPPQKETKSPPLASAFFLSHSPVPYLNDPAPRNTRVVEPQERGNVPGSLFSIPRHIINVLLNHYCATYRPQYPAIEEPDLYKACNRVYNDTQPSAFDKFCVNITLAISMNTLIQSDKKRAAKATSVFWNTAVNQLDELGPSNTWEWLQSLQLLAHYGFLSPKDIDCSKCAAAATRLCLQLGLHHELPPSAKTELKPEELNTRRRLFWNAYSIDSAVNTVRCRPFIWPKSALTARFPDFESQSYQTLHVWLLRQIETEITLAMYHPSIATIDTLWGSSFDQWFTRIHERLKEWHQTIRQNIILTERIEFHELLFQCQILRLNRPSPRFPSPTEEMCRTSFQSSLALIKEFSFLDQKGKLFYLWHAAYYLVESGVCLLASIVSGMEFVGQERTQLGGENITTLITYIPKLPSLLWKVSNRWSDITPHASALESISFTVLEILEQWSVGGTIDGFIFYEIKQKLHKLSVFSPFPLDLQVPANDFIQHPALGPGDEFHTVLNDQPTEPDVAVSAFDAAYFIPSLPDPSLVLQDSSSIFPNAYNGEFGNAPVLDFSATDIEEILTSLSES
ncbi:hypothetical protein BGW36DRAFT_465142 [Talaromyces proteolyticus]|uniref:Zn(2)-C6 fungal-type domain-containing protein n=1 Tax=Talaromyces proteolyticus TaxID=1131652 RepID=A0AAD4KGT2_9EURO|nr:uncharacterized protein BGW36DRAFT_465142 [Talaromyces proteolyticus]KAH8691390.1 hypothetical protein BGW36DRAFT_465142 [Talaromyces proteolyticus]